MTIRFRAARAASPLALMCALFSTTALAEASGDPLTDIILVTGERPDQTADTLQPGKEPVPRPDAASLVARAPGAALVDNGGLSGQVQYRGAFGDRVLVRVNGQRFGSGGPNLMDPPLHYAPMVLVDHIELDRGIGPVSDGPGLAGGVNAVLKQVRFADGSMGLRPTADIGALYRSVDDSYAVGGVAGLANGSWRIGLLAAREEGNDYRFDGGRVTPSSHERTSWGAHAGFRRGAGELSLEYRRSETDPTGNAPFPMDILYFNTDFLRAGYRLDISDTLRLEGAMGHVAVRHLMANNILRPLADPARARATFAEADTTTADVALRMATAGGFLRVGGDVELGTKDVRITNPNNAAFFLVSLNGIENDRYGGFVEWTGALGPVQAELGARVDRFAMRAGAPDLGAAVPMGPRTLAAAFAASDRDWRDTTFDLSARLWADLGAFTPRLTLARKMRVPGPLERFSWLPTEASAGLADGNIYVGNPLLVPETAWIAEVGIDVESGGFHARPTLFYRRIDDFVQGQPFDASPGVVNTPVEMVAAMNGDPTPLQWANVDAEFYGVDLDFGAKLVGSLRLDGVASYVRGKRRDIADNLYRIAPPNLRMGLTWDGTGWSVTAEGHAVARQNRVSASNDEQPGDGYVLANLYAGIDVRDKVRLDGGIENLFDRSYEQHLAGYNRAAGSNVPLGARLPGAGRSGFVRLRIAY